MSDYQLDYTNKHRNAGTVRACQVWPATSRTTYYRLININQATSRHQTSAQIAAQPRHIAPPNSAPHHATSYLICKLRAMQWRNTAIPLNHSDIRHSTVIGGRRVDDSGLKSLLIQCRYLMCDIQLTRCNFSFWRRAIRSRPGPPLSETRESEL